MPSHMSNVGFPVEDEEDFAHYARYAARHGQSIPAGNGTYVKWEAGEGVQLWAQLDADGAIIGLVPHFAGKSSMRVGLVARLNRPNESKLDGSFYGWANPAADPQSGDYPFVFDTPDFATHASLALPSVHNVQLAAFAEEIEAYANDEEFASAQEEPPVAPESVIPSGSFTEGEEVGQVPEAYARLSGHVLETATLTNPATDTTFLWARVRTLGGEVDIVADPELLDVPVVPGDVVSGSFWLSGRIVE
ncbi:MAG: hypothetical protein ACYC1C_21425 [Chloroflexota bacterium]